MSSRNISTRETILRAAWQLLEANSGQAVQMKDIARQAGISRQAMYLHFASRLELLKATLAYIDQEKGLEQRLRPFEQAGSGRDRLRLAVEVWGNYIPEIHGVARALVDRQPEDQAARAAFDDCMACLREACITTIGDLQNEQALLPEWNTRQAVDIMYTLLSIRNWEMLRLECGWSQERYVRGLLHTLQRSLLVDPAS